MDYRLQLGNGILPTWKILKNISSRVFLFQVFALTYLFCFALFSSVSLFVPAACLLVQLANLEWATTPKD